MAKLDGLAAAEQIAAARIAPVVILTAFSQRELDERSRRDGVRGEAVPREIEMAVSRYAEIAALERKSAA